MKQIKPILVLADTVILKIVTVRWFKITALEYRDSLPHADIPNLQLHMEQFSLK